MDEHPIADLHCHYPMHLLAEAQEANPYAKALRDVPKRRLWRKLRAIGVRIAARLLNFDRCNRWRVSLARLARGEVRLVFSVLYVPEAELGLTELVTDAPQERSFAELKEHLLQVETRLTGRDGGPRRLVAKKASELEGAPGDDAIRFVHCVEGGFHLGLDPERLDARVRWLAEHGVAYITLAHLFWRRVATNAPALPRIPDSVYDRVFPQPDGVGLDRLGEAAVRAMYRYGVLVDISHMRQPAIEETFALLAALDRETGREPHEYPVIATHAGFRFGNHSYMLSPETIEAVAGRAGVVGLIMGHDLLNDGLHRRRGRLGRTEKTLRRHIGRIHGLTESFDHIGIGSDLDGFVKPTVGGIEYVDDLQKIARWLHEAYPSGAEAMLFGNAMRVLHAAYARRAAAGIL
jgi:microsomal dipeptidase-like Zn-dependent dipeptidase